MKINKAFLYELKPNNKQLDSLNKHCGVARFAWNWGLARSIKLFDTENGLDKFTNSKKLHKELNLLKKTEFSWMYEVSKCAPQEALRDLENAYNEFRKKWRLGFGFPKFKKKGKRDSFRLTGAIHVTERHVILPRIGKIRTKENTLKLKGRILSATINRKADRWFVSFQVESEANNTNYKLNGIVGIDWGINNFATIFDGKEITKYISPRPLQTKIKQIKKLNKQHSKKQNGSNNKRRQSQRIARLYLHIHNIRKDFINKLTSELAKTKSVICIEDINIKNMAKHPSISRSVEDSGYGMFKDMLRYKTIWYGSKLIIIGMYEPSTKTCSNCGYVLKELDMSTRQWVCPNCGISHDRDENASKNIRSIGIRLLNTEGSSEIHACGESVSPRLKKAVLAEAGNKHKS